MDSIQANDLGMHLNNAAQVFYNMANNHTGISENTLQEHADFIRMGDDMIFTWHHVGETRQVSLNDVWEFMNGHTRDQINQLLETVSNLEERLESMEFYGNDNAESA